MNISWVERPLSQSDLRTRENRHIIIISNNNNNNSSINNNKCFGNTLD